MNNEILFFLQTILVAASILGVFFLGKEALVAGITFFLVLANLFVVKQIALFGFNVTAADVYVIGAVLGSNLLQEFYGAKIAQKTIWISFFIALVFIVMSSMHLWYEPNMYDFADGSYRCVLGFAPRLVGASFVSYVVSQYIRLLFYGFLQGVYRSRFLVVRNVVVTVVEQAVDTVLFGFLGLYGVVHALTDLFLLSFFIKIITILCMIPWIMFVRRYWRERAEGDDGR